MDDRVRSVYFAHPLVHYDEEIETECIFAIVSMLGEDIAIFNPNQKWLSDLYKARKAANHKDPFGIFREIAKAHDIIVGATFMDGIIGAGVATELKEGVENNKDCYLIYINKGVKMFLPFTTLDNYQTLDIGQTRKRTKLGEL
jgi:hypothetical protein